MKRVFYINELNYPDGVHRFDKHRLPQAYMDHLGWFSVSYNTFASRVSGPDDILIFQTPTSDELLKLQTIVPFLDSNVVLITQESSIFDWFDWHAEEQQLYISILAKAKAFMYHSHFDMEIMKAFCSTFIKYPGCTNLVIDTPKQFQDGLYALIPNPIKRFQRGMITHKLVVDTVKDMPIYSMRYNPPQNYQLSFPEAYTLPGIQLIDRLPSDQWMQLVYGAKFGVDINREFSGGNCSLEFGSLGVPLIGNEQLDTQRDIFPDISFEFSDYTGIKQAIHRLNTDEDFYMEVSYKALQNIKTHYSSEIVTRNFQQQLASIL